MRVMHGMIGMIEILGSIVCWLVVLESRDVGVVSF